MDQGNVSQVGDETFAEAKAHGQFLLGPWGAHQDGHWLFVDAYLQRLLDHHRGWNLFHGLPSDFGYPPGQQTAAGL